MRLCCKSVSRWLVPGLAAILLPAALLAADNDKSATSPALAAKVTGLVADLDAPTRSARAAARQSLIALGPAILPLLPDEHSITSAAAREALAQIREQLQRDAAKATVAPSRVTVRGSFPARVAFEWLQKQTGNSFDLASLEPSLLAQPIAVDFRDRPFWSACDELLRKTGLTYAATGRRGTIKLVPRARGGASELAVIDDGVVRIAVESATLRSAFDDPSRQFLRIGWTFLAEPRLRPLFARLRFRDLVVTDARSTAIKPVSPGATLELSMEEGGQLVRLDSDFAAPARWLPTGVVFRGLLRTELAAGPQRVVFDKLASGRGRSQRAGAATVALRSVEIGDKPGIGGAARLTVSVFYDRGGPAFDSFRTWTVHNDAVLESKNGRRIEPRNVFLARQQDDGTVEVEYNFADVGPLAGYRFLYTVPTLITDLPISFQFPRIPVATTSQGVKR